MSEFEKILMEIRTWLQTIDPVDVRYDSNDSYIRIEIKNRGWVKFTDYRGGVLIESHDLYRKGALFPKRSLKEVRQYIL
jgi:hypothetical protein